MTTPAPLTERLDGFLVRHRRRVLGGLLLLAVFLRVMVGMELAGGPLVRISELVPASDNAFFVTWSQHLAEEDWLQRQPLHPMPPWMRKVAGQVMREHPDVPVRLGLARDKSYDPSAMSVRLWDHWLGGATYFQEPLYPYLLALTRVVAGPSTWSIFAWQGVLGVAMLWLVYLVGRRLLGETVGVVAALLGLGYAPFIVHEFALLRDSLIVFATMALLWALLEALERGGWRWALFGALCGGAILLKVPFLFFVVLALAGALLSRRCGPRDASLALGCMMLAMMPALVRNALVGVPLFRLNGSGNAMLAIFHVKDALPAQFLISKHYADILVQEDGHLLPSLVAAIQTHGSLTHYLLLCVQKLVSLVHGEELPNNVDVNLFLQACGLLRAMPVSFWLLALLGAVGLMATAGRWRRVWPLYIAIAAGVPTILLASMLARYRLPIAAAMLPLSASGLLALGEWTKTHRWGALATTGLLALLYVPWAVREHVIPGTERSAAQYRRLGRLSMDLDPEFAALHFRECLRWNAELADCELGLGQALLQQGQVEEGLAALRQAAALSQSDPTTRQAAEQLLQAHGGP
ncbi:ArnT family glycosyltransferase [Corallococcus caeni]|uniref:ArnT family glycosyltransferase n=1 Tax=Corallococcus caeni TaxID=3082388 RepID=UPI0030C74715